MVTTRSEFKQLIENRKTNPSKIKLCWECNEGHEWMATYNNIKIQKSGCPYCYGNAPISYNDCLNLAERKGFIFLTTKEDFLKVMKNKIKIPSKMKLKWKCQNGHKWKAAYNNIKNGETGCPYCYGNIPISHQDCLLLASRRGFDFITSKYEFDIFMRKRDTVPSKVKLRWKCIKGHVWEAFYNDIQQGRGCPRCAEGIYEEIFRWYFERIFNIKFKKVKLSKLIPFYKGNMHLDGFAKFVINNHEIKLAFEFNGIQHYEFPHYFYKSYHEFLEQKYNDLKKKKLCSKNGIILIVFPQKVDIKMNHPEIIQRFIIEDFEKKTGHRLSNVRQYSHLIKNSKWKGLDNFL